MTWTRTTLGEIADIKGRIGWRGYTVEDLRDSGPLALGATQISANNEIDLSKPTHISREKYEESPEIQLETGDIVVVKVGNTIGKVAIIRRDLGPATLNPNAVALKRVKANRQYLFYYLLTDFAQHFLKSRSLAAAQPAINQTTLKEMPVSLPEPEAQERIASILSAYDELMENCQRRIRLLEAMARALYREWFVQFRFPSQEKVKRIASPLGEIPEGWQVKPVESFCLLVSRGVTPKYEAGSGRFIINQKVNRGSELSLDDLKELEPSLEIPADKFARFADVLVNCLGEGTIGRVHFYTEANKDWAIDQHMSICRAVKPSDSLYVYFALESPEGQGRITSLKTGGTNMTMFNISALRSFALVSPPAKMVNRFAELVLPMLRQKQALTELNRNLRRTRDLLLPRLLSGQVELETEAA